MGSSRKSSHKKNRAQDVEWLRSRLAETEDTISAIRDGRVDALVVSGTGGERVFTLAGSESGYRLFVESMSEGAATIGLDGTILYCNRALADLLSRPLERVMGAAVMSFVTPESASAFEAAFRAGQQQTAKIELELAAADGHRIPVLVSLRAFQEFGAEAICMVVTDLTEQKRQEQIVSAANLSRMILEQSAEAIAVCDTDGHIILASQALHRLCNGNPLLRHFDDALSVQMQPEAGGNEAPRSFSVSEVLKGERLQAVEVNVRKTDGETCDFLLSAAPVRLPGSDTGGCVISLFDIQERKRAEEVVRKSERLAATGRLAATIAHEINNPLESITNLLYLIRMMPDLNPAVQQYVEMAQSELGRVAHITKQTLAFHRESNQPATVDLKSLIESVVYLYGQRLNSKSIQFQQDVRCEGRIYGFASELRQVISNLFDNAIEACPPGGHLRLRVHRSIEWTNSHKPGVRIVIADDGPGIAAKDCQRIFEPFYTTKGERGSGLGLWVSQGIVHKHGGFIRLWSSTRPEKSGTVISVFLPERQARRDADTAVA